MRLRCARRREEHANERIGSRLRELGELFLRARTFAREEKRTCDERRVAVVAAFFRACGEGAEESVCAIAEGFVDERRWIESGFSCETDDERAVFDEVERRLALQRMLEPDGVA